MFVPIFDSWGQPVGSFATRGAALGVMLAKLELESVLQLEHHGASILAVVSDGAGNNRSMWTHLGIFGKLDQATNKVPHPSLEEGRFLHFLCDVLHIMKCIENHLLTHTYGMDEYYFFTKRIKTNPGTHKVNFDNYKQLYKTEEENQLKVVPKLTTSHVNPSKLQKMNVRLATQLFSRSVAIGLKFYRERKTLGFADTQVIREFLKMLNSTEKSCKEDNTKMFASHMSVESLRVTLMSVLDVIDLLHKQGVPYILTVKLNQDPLEVKDTPSSAGGSHQLQLCHDLTDESISLELDESTDDQQGELLRATVEEECQHKDAATSCSTISAKKFPSLLHRAVGPSARAPLAAENQRGRTKEIRQRTKEAEEEKWRQAQVNKSSLLLYRQHKDTITLVPLYDNGLGSVFEGAKVCQPVTKGMASLPSSSGAPPGQGWFLYICSKQQKVTFLPEARTYARRVCVADCLGLVAVCSAVRAFTINSFGFTREARTRKMATLTKVGVREALQEKGVPMPPGSPEETLVRRYREHLPRSDTTRGGPLDFSSDEEADTKASTACQHGRPL
ncbi:hypothetical protein HPB51_011352 [Rhipicephalus microplus]|uniref:Transposable element n=1 Tax=Rhipicephalus microplus TaxID=6941 RepID=A0A9J6DG91_RHIMP|nr:hypothetical protein HPB51_011352 [Rhipicephalus microplus]